MNDEQAGNLRDLLASRSTAALGTLHDGAPYVSMVPFALLADLPAFVLHVSRLAAHTRDMLSEPRVSLLISASEQAGVSPLALARLTILGTARPLTHDAPLFSLGDFSLFLILPGEARWIAGFAQARTLTSAGFAKAMREGNE